ncbi:A24 family peptidase [Neisseriaceae bacterium CLB008]
MVNGLAGWPWLVWWQAHPVLWLTCSVCLGALLSPLLWRLALWMPLRLHYAWQAAAQQELGLRVEPPPSWGSLWAQAQPREKGVRLGRLCLGLLSATAFGLVAWRQGVSVLAVWGWALSLWLLLLATIDARTHLLPDALTLSLLWLGLMVHLVAGDAAALAAGVLGAMVGYAVLWLVAWLFKLCTAQEGMGYGDFKLFAALGAWLGWTALPWVLFVAAGLGVLWALASGRFGRSAIPFGPSLALAGWLTWLWGPIY